MKSKLIIFLISIIKSTLNHFKFLFDDDKLLLFRYIILAGGRGSGKSTSIAMKLIRDSFYTTCKTLVIQSTYSAMQDASYAELVSVINRFNMNKYFKCTTSPLSIENLVTKATFVFRGTDNSDKIKSISNIENIWFEEADLINEQDFDTIDLSARGEGKNVKIFISFNPNNPYTWIRKYIDKSNDINNKIYYNHSTYLVNEFLDESFRLKMDRLKEENILKYRRDGLGEFIVADGVCINNSKIKIVNNIDDVCKLENIKLNDIINSYVGFGLDFGSVHPTALTKLYYNRYLNIIIITDVISSPVDTMSTFINKKIPQYFKLENGKLLSTCNNMFADCASPMAINEFKKAGYNFKGCNKNKTPVKEYINFMNGCKQIYVLSRAQSFVSECSIWKYKKNTDEPEKINDDINDAIRYSLQPILEDLRSGKYISANGLY